MPDTQFIFACNQVDIPANSSRCVEINGKQIAIFNYTLANQWFATDNQCPHWQENVLSRGLLGADDQPYVACPLHKRKFSLHTGQCLNDSDESMKILCYDIKIEGEKVYIAIPS